jgi:hypothetical protein
LNQTFITAYIDLLITLTTELDISKFFIDLIQIF